MTEATEEQRWSEVEEGAEVGLKAIATVDKSPSNGNAAIVSPKDEANSDGESSESGSHQSHNNRDSGSFSYDGISDISKFDGDTIGKKEIEAGESSRGAGEVIEEEIVELEFEKVKPKLATHTMHCPNCKSEVTKVVLRRKMITFRPPPETPAKPVKQERDPKDLVGCFSCLSLFTCSENGCFNPFDIFRKRTEPEEVVLPSQTNLEGAKPMVNENENCLSMFLVFKKKQKVAETERVDDPPETNPVSVDRDFTVSDQPTPPKYVTGQSTVASVHSPPPPSSIVEEFPSGVDIDEPKKGLILGGAQVLPPSSNAPGDDDHDTTIVGDYDAETTIVARVRGRPWLGHDGILVEILKSIVYGGLMEVIASLSLVASAAASNTATLNIVALALASLIGGIFIIGHNIWDLRDDCYKNSSQEATNKYKELLGRVNYFPLHAIFAILSFLVFGMIPPVAYGFSFYKTNDKDFTMLAVGVLSLLCVTLLAIFKAFVNKCRVFDYFKTVVYYITTAVAVSGVSYVAGNLVTRLMEELGLFDTSSGGGVSLLPHATGSLASF